MSLGKLTSALIAAATGAALPAVMPSTTSVWSILVLGIPLSVLAAALGGAAVRALREPGAPDGHIPAKVLGIVSDGFIGGWLAMFLINVPAIRSRLGGDVSPEVIGALCALLAQFIRAHAKEYFDQFYTTVLGLFARRKGTPVEPPTGDAP